MKELARQLTEGVTSTPQNLLALEVLAVKRIWNGRSMSGRDLRSMSMAPPVCKAIVCTNAYFSLLICVYV